MTVPTLSRPLDGYRGAEFSLEELAAAAGRLLKRMAVRPTDGRVAGVPDERAIRFYQTAGLVDRPLRYDGRRAVYGYHHLVQLLAVKRLQQEGHSLSLIQRSLAGRSAAALEAALEQAEGRADPAPSSRVPADARRLLAVELADGVTLTVDPLRVHDAAGVVARVTELFRKSMEDRQ
jgi:DNA-binding transcriptional MerR regulator